MTNKVWIHFFLVLIVFFAFTNVSDGIVLNPTKEQIKNAIITGEENPGNEIYDTEFFKSVIFGNFPGFGGGLIKSKLFEVVLISAKMRKARRRYDEKDAFKFVESKKHLSITYRGGDDVFKIKLRQGFRLIEPVKMIRSEGEDTDSGRHVDNIVAIFPYFKLDPYAVTTIMVVRDFGTNEYEVDFSKIK